MKCLWQLINMEPVLFAKAMLIPATVHFIVASGRCFSYVIVSLELCLSHVIAYQAYISMFALGDVLNISLALRPIFH